jgi:hypothetical protein
MQKSTFKKKYNENLLPKFSNHSKHKQFSNKLSS